MEFLVWHYTKGIDYYINRWIFYVKYILHYFSLETLLFSLFAPWKRMIEVDRSPGFNFQKYFETFMFNLISRGIGAVVRIIIFFAGLLILTFTFFGGALGILIWILIPIIGLPNYLKHIRRPEQFINKLLWILKKVKEKQLK